MQALIDRIEQEGSYLGQGIIKVDSFVNHQLDPALTTEMGHAFAERLAAAGVSGLTKVVTAEVSGIPPAMATAQVLGVPLVWARKKRPITMPDGYYVAEAPSHTKGGLVQLMISPEFLHPSDRVVLIDDFLARGYTCRAMVELVHQSGAEVCAIGCVIEKPYEGGRILLDSYNLPIITLAKIDLDGNQLKVSP